MTAEQFAYWLQGYAELHAAPPSAEQWASIRDHLATVFNKVTPPVSGAAPWGREINDALRRAQQQVPVTFPPSAVRLDLQTPRSAWTEC